MNYLRGWLLHFCGCEARAFAAFVAAFRGDPQDVGAARHLAAIAARRQQFDVAEKWFEAVLALKPDDGASWFNLGFVRERVGKPGAALAAFREATRCVPQQDRAWYGMGLAHAQLGQHGEAAAALERAATLQPLNGAAWYQWGMACHCAGRPDDVRRIVTRLLAFDPKRAAQLARDAGRADLLKLIPQLPF